MSKKLLLLGSALAVAAVTAPGAAVAQEARGDSVTDRARPEYEPLGIRAGTLMLLPSLTLGVESVDNLFPETVSATGVRSEESDFGYSARAALGVSSDWGRHYLEGAAGVQQTTFQDFDTEDRTDEFARASLRLDFLRDSYLRFGASYQNLGEGRGAPTSSSTAADAIEPLDYDLVNAFAQVSHTFNRLRLGGEVAMTDWAYEDRVALRSGAVGDFSVRDRTQMEYIGRAEYAVSPSTALLVEGSFNTRDYDKNRDAITGLPVPTRDSEGYEVLVGANLDLSRLVRGEFGIGFLQQDYDNVAIGTLEGVGLDAEIEWFATPITTVTFTGARSIEDVFDGTVDAFAQTTVGVDVDHELLRNLIVSGGVAYFDRDFEVRVRSDQEWRGEVGARYLVNRVAEIGGSYQFSNLESDRSPGGDVSYDINRFLATLTLRR
jgi:hypothetical protein